MVQRQAFNRMVANTPPIGICVVLCLIKALNTTFLPVIPSLSRRRAQVHSPQLHIGDVSISKSGHAFTSSCSTIFTLRIITLYTNVLL